MMTRSSTTDMTAPRLVVPIRDFDGYSRLASVLAPPQRRTIAIAMADRMRHAAADANLAMTVVSGSTEVRRWAEDAGSQWMDDPGGGLDVACGSAIEGAPSWVVAHADLPGIDGTLLRSVAEDARTGFVIIPSVDGGTNVMGGNEPARFSFGPGSFHRHLAAHPHARVVVAPAATIEIDTPAHLRSLPRPWLPSTLPIHDELLQRAP